MAPKLLVFLLAAAFVLPGCFVERSYYVSPFNGNSGPYHTIPLKSDSVKSAYYAHAAFGFGGANQQGRDGVLALHAGVSGGHNLGFLQAFYSLNTALGNYSVGPWSGHLQKENKMFSGAGLEGGLNVVIPFGKDEWRVIGVEGAWLHEWGHYGQYRKRLDAATVDVLVKNNDFTTLGGYTEYIARIQDFALGFRLGAGSALGRGYRNLNYFNTADGERLTYRYFNFTMHLSQNRYTAYIKTTAATRATGALLGVNYRLGK